MALPQGRFSLSVMVLDAVSGRGNSGRRLVTSRSSVWPYSNSTARSYKTAVAR